MTHEEAIQVARVISRADRPADLYRRLEICFPQYPWYSLVQMAYDERATALIASDDDVDALDPVIA